MGSLPDWIIALTTVVNLGILIYVVFVGDRKYRNTNNTLLKAVTAAILTGSQGTNPHSIAYFNNALKDAGVKETFEDILHL